MTQGGMSVDPRIRLWANPLVPARCRLCSSPADVRSGLCEAHGDRALDMLDEARGEQ